jgi:hypothetical protein
MSISVAGAEAGNLYEGGPVKFFALLQTVREGRSTKIHDFKGLLAKILGGIYKISGC